FTRGGFVLCRGACGYTSVPAVVAHSRYVGPVVYDRRVVNVVNVRDVDVVYGAVVVEAIAFPSSAFVPVAKVPEAVVDAAIEPHSRTPISLVENESHTVPSPVRRGPQKARLWRQHPRPRHPVIVVKVRVPSPIARSPKVAFARTNRLFVHRQLGRRKTHRNS